MAKVKIRAENIVELLQQRHKDDVFFAEVNMGSAWMHKHGSRRLDAWAMLRTYSPPKMYGYEIKVSRSDFVKDEKWMLYLPACHYFYFVAPGDKIVSKNEVPAECGLIHFTSKGDKLRIIKKAPRRNIELPVNMMMHLLMSRTRPVRNSREANQGYVDTLVKEAVREATDTLRVKLTEAKHRINVGANPKVAEFHELLTKLLGHNTIWTSERLTEVIKELNNYEEIQRSLRSAYNYGTYLRDIADQLQTIDLKEKSDE